MYIKISCCATCKKHGEDLNCHSTCKEYLLYKEKNDAINNDIRRERNYVNYTCGLNLSKRRTKK